MSIKKSESHHLPCLELPLETFRITTAARISSTPIPDSFQTLAGTIYDRYDEVLNFFNDRSTNASAEAFNSKVKNFRASLRGVSDVRFFLFRLQKIYA